MPRKTVHLRAVACLAAISVISVAAVTSAAAEESHTDADPVVVSEQLESGNEMIVYVPGGSGTGYRAVSTPILLVLDDEAVTVESAAELAEASGLADIAQQEQGIVAFLNPEDSQWAASDRDGVIDLLDRFGDNTGGLYDDDGKSSAGLYPGGKSRVYLFADGSGADFVSTQAVPGIEYVGPFSKPDGSPNVLSWTPAAVFLSNPTALPIAPTLGAEVAAYIVNGSSDIDAAYRALTPKNPLFGAQDSPVTDGFDRTAVLDGYDQVVSHAIVRVADVNPFNELYTIPDYAAEGIDVSHETVDVDGTPLEYFQYLPDSADRANLPVLFLFHGGGNHAEYQAWATGWPLIAQEHGFMVVSVNRHVDRSASDIIGLLDHLISQYPGIDQSRVYASGYSMGAAKSWQLGEEFTQRFAAISPTNGSFQPATPSNALMMPTFYIAGAVSPLPELPSQEYVFGQYSRQPNDIDARLDTLFRQNQVSDGFVFDAAADHLWGVAPDASFTVEDTQFTGLSVTVNEYTSANGGTYTALASVANGSHEPFHVAAELAWDFMSKFSRDSDGSVTTTDAPVATAAPEVTGTLDVGTRATATPGTWTVPAATPTYQWLRNGEPIRGATKSTYTVRAGDQGAGLSVQVTATADGFTTGQATSAERTVRALAHAKVSPSATLGTTKTSFSVAMKVTAVRGIPVNGPVTITIGTNTYTGELIDGKATISIGKLPRGVHLVRAVFDGSSSVSPTTARALILVR